MPDFEFEDKYKGFVAGIDEAGRGPWIGPVVAAAVMFLNRPAINPHLLGHLNDSKKLSTKRREELYSIIQQEAQKKNLIYAIGQASAEEIDKINILQATFLAMNRAAEQLSIRPEMVLIDGNRTPNQFICDNTCIIQGDSKSYSIAAASIIAKVYRDHIMAEMAKQYPFYGLEKNAGYGTKEHIEGLKKYGICPQHRRSYKPIKELLSFTK